MGLDIDRERFDESDYVRFAERLEQCLAALRELLQRPGFGQQPRTLGAELELFLVDREGRPVPRNKEVLAAVRDPRVTVELDRFNLELNPRPSPLAGLPFSALADELRDLLAEVGQVAAAQSLARVAVIGILPTLRPHDLEAQTITDAARYRALDYSLRRLRRQPFHVRIEGRDRLDLTTRHVALEGANTSFQVHLRVPPEQFAPTFNAAQLATAPVLAAAGNSPTLLGRWLWEETRIALFEQAVDGTADEVGDRRRPRVTFGGGWVHDGALELFEQGVRLHEPLLPILGDEDPVACTSRGEVPRLDELRLHQGTVWRWNRAIYDWSDGGHLRVEMRALPAGPTVVDMLANAAFLVGLVLALAPTAPAWVEAFPFERARENFYEAARRGLDATLFWPTPDGEPVSQPAGELVLRLLRVARDGLRDAGVGAADVARLDVVHERVGTGQTGARWQWQAFRSLEPAVGRERAFADMLEHYLTQAQTGRPVHAWHL